jgi:hypothetical protein
MGAVVIAFALVAILLTGSLYYLVIPYYYNIKAHFDADPSVLADARAQAFGTTIYNIVGIFPMIFFGAIALNSWVQMHRQSNQDEGFG